MNVDYFLDGLQLLSYTGLPLLNPEQVAIFENSLICLQSENKFPQIFFWGRVNGTNADYYIAFGYLKDCLRGRRFFFTIDWVHWYLLPPANPEQFEATRLAEPPFTGDISIVIEVVLDPTFIIEPNGSILPAVAEHRSLKEEDRLACLVTLITEEAALLPRSSLTKQMSGKTVFNPAFTGLCQAKAAKIDQYQLYRQPQNKWNSNLLRQSDYNYNTDIFDTVDSIVPSEQAFALTIENDRGVVVIRSLFWPGMVFVHKCRSRKHGFAYFGDGRKNLDILFMLNNFNLK